MSSHLCPTFFIIGERKCGTSSLYRYLLEHPLVLPGPRKEMQFFSHPPDYIEKHVDDYLSSFPLGDGERTAVLDWPELDHAGVLYNENVSFQRDLSLTYVTGEASADTFCNVSPALLRQYLPKLQLLLLLRDPVDRAFSHHRMFQRFQEEGRSLDFVVGDFASDMQLEIQRVQQGETTPCLSPGIYIQHIREWSETWEPSQLLVLFSSDLNRPETCKVLMQKVLSHIGLHEHDYRDSLKSRYNQAPSATMSNTIREELTAFYSPYSEALQDHLQINLPWLSP